MDAIIAALIGFAGTIVGGLVTALVPNTAWYHQLSSKTRHHSLIGTWRSAWGPLPKGPTQYEELLSITSQRGQRVEGHITMSTSHEPARRWLIEGRYDGLFLQLFYFPAADPRNADFLSHGCYFFTRKADGSFAGYSTGYDNFDDDPIAEGVTTDFHTLTRQS